MLKHQLHPTRRMALVSMQLSPVTHLRSPLGLVETMMARMVKASGMPEEGISCTFRS